MRRVLYTIALLVGLGVAVGCQIPTALQRHYIYVTVRDFDTKKPVKDAFVQIPEFHDTPASTNADGVTSYGFDVTGMRNANFLAAYYNTDYIATRETQNLDFDESTTMVTMYVHHAKVSQ